MLEAGHNQRSLARQTGVSQPRISAVLNGLGSFSTSAATRIKHALRDRVDWEDLVRMPRPMPYQLRKQRKARR
jgi:transcriptional regulator with XRE-family HTH domain